MVGRRAERQKDGAEKFMKEAQAGPAVLKTE